MNYIKKELEQAIQGIDILNLNNAIDRWDLIILLVRTITRKYTTQKAKIKNTLEKYILAKMQKLETVQNDNMTTKQKEKYLYYKERYKQIIDEEIQGHHIRTRGQPTYEINEPDIQFYAKLEIKFKQKSIVAQLQDKDGQIQTSNEEMIKIAEDYYTKLYTPSKINLLKQQQLLKNIDKAISANSRLELDAKITEGELKTAVMQLQDNKSPGLDGITAEFYKTYWYLIKDDYLRYINEAKLSSFGEHRNTSVTTIIYKHKTEKYIYYQIIVQFLF